MKISLIDILRTALVRLEDGSQIRQDDPDLTEVKSTLVRAMANLELKRLEKVDGELRAFAS